MKFSERWLRNWVNPPWNTQQLADKLTMAGLEVESITPLGSELAQVYIGKVISAEQHPNADRLRVCQVVFSETEQPTTIVCGAPNVRAGLKVAVAKVEAVLPGNIEIKRAKLRGVDSEGMICSTAELGLPEGSGILELPEDAPLGALFSEYWQIPDTAIEIYVTPNRGDCLSLLGIAREISVLSDLPLNTAEDASKNPPEQITDTLPISVPAANGCPHYLGRVIRGVNSSAITPLWMQERLRRSGLRVIHPVVDITNYVMLELGQPLHAFDLQKIHQEIIVRGSNPGEEVELLDGQRLRLQEPALVIADAQKILALAGIMGGAESAVSTTTQDIFLESAFFTPNGIRRTLRRHIIQSDAGYRYERGVDPQLTARAMQRATELLLTIVGGQAGPIVERHSEEFLPNNILLRRERIGKLLGITIADAEVENILTRLSMQVQKDPQGWRVTPPSYRFDIHIEVDLIEELARIYGYDAIPATTAQSRLTLLPSSEQQIPNKRLRQFMTDKGYYEAITYSFVDPKLAQLLDPDAQFLPLKNPISAEMAVMRKSLWPGLLQALTYNLNRQVEQIRLFETGLCFAGQGEELQQVPRLAAVVSGDYAARQWGLKQRPVDFFDIKGDLEELLKLTKTTDYSFTRIDHPALHPGRAAALHKNGKEIGKIGELHPNILQALDVTTPIYVFEVLLREITQAMLPSYTAPSKYPSIRRDLAFIFGERIPYQEIEQKIRANAGEALQSLQLFDIYQGQGISPGQRSVALCLTFQLASRTLIDQEVDQAVSQVIHALRQDLQAVLRD